MTADTRTPEPTRVAILGLGSIGRTHAAALREVGSDAAILVAASGGTPEMLTEHGWPDAEHVAPSELIGRGDIDILVITTPSGSHAREAIAAVEAGHHVVVEKPIATTVEDATAVLQAARAADRRVYPVAQRRLEPQHRHIRRLLDDGTLGRPLLGEIRVHWYRDADYYAAAAWRAQMPAGGSLMNQGLHSIDLLSWFLGPIRSVTAQTATLANGGDAEDTAVLTLESAAGALGTVVTTTATPPGDAAALALRTDRGVLELAHTDVVRWDLPDVAPPDSTSGVQAGSSDPAAIGIAGHLDLWRDVLDAHRDGREATVGAVDGWRTVALIDAAYRSAETGQRVPVPDPPG